MSTPRVVSLVPSATESLAAWGVTPIAVTRFCERPDLPTVGGTKNPDLDAIVALAPDLVVMCVEENRKPDADALVARGLAIHAIEIDRVDDVEPELRRLSTVLDLDVEIESTPPPLPPSGVRAFVPIWRRPWMTINGDTYAHSMLAHLGIDTVFAGSSTRYPEVTVDDVVAAAPSVVLAPSEPYEFTEKHRTELEAFAPVVFVDGQDLVWWGTRTPAALRRLATALDPYVRT